MLLVKNNTNMGMKKYFFCWVVLVSLFFIDASGLSAQTFSNYDYEADAANIANPERGFYKHTETQSGTYSFLNESALRAYRSQGFTLILRVFYLSDFVSTPITEQYLASMQQDFNTARAAGIKIIVRFAYTKRSNAPYGDAAPEWVLKHIAKLAPVLKQNGDVIAVVQAGFIGAWGEWYYTDHFSASLGDPNATDWENRRALVNALLDATPVNRAVQLRTPAIKFSILETTEALQEAEAFTGTKKSRLGHHNDCFLASPDDVGTYTSKIEAEKTFLEQETKYLPMGGETCGESIPLSECPNALAQMERFHWSYLNRDYHQGVIGSWQTGDCLEEVFQKLGYRYRLTKSSLQQNSKPGGIVQFTIHLLNDGWANPFNERRVEVILRNSATGKVLTLPVVDDPRKWALGDTIKLAIEGGLPANVGEGQYEVFLNFPDPEKSLQWNPDYSIRLANTETWEAETGFNRLHHTLIVSKTANVATYTGSAFFLSRPIVNEFSSILIDGLNQDWQNIDPLANGQLPSQQIKVFNDADSIYILLQDVTNADAFEIFIDADVASASGDLTQPWNYNYADYRVGFQGLSVYEGGIWSAPQLVSINESSGVIEIGIHNNQFSAVPLQQRFEIAVSITSNGQTIYIPLSDEAFATYNLLLTTPVDVKATSSGNKVILYWGNEMNDHYRVIERSENNGSYEKIAMLSPGSYVYIDRVTESALVKYRTHSTTDDGLNVSTYSTPYSIQTTARPAYYIFETNGIADEWEDVQPLSTATFQSETQAYRIFISAEKLNILFEGAPVTDYAFYFDIDNSILTGSAANAWAYQGFDYVLRNDSLFDLTSGENFVMLADNNVATAFFEIAVPLSALEGLNDNTIIYTAGFVKTGFVKIGDETLYFPGTNKSPVKFLRTLPSLTPASVAVSNSENLPESQLVVQWQACAGCKGYIVERSENANSEFTEIARKNAFTFAHYDDGLTAGTTYYYRVYSYNDAGLSVASPVASGTPNAITGVEDKFVNQILIYPNPTHDLIHIKSSAKAIHIELLDMTGRILIRDILNNNDTVKTIDVSALSRGIYIIKIQGQTSNTFRVSKR